jgi:hypothetical protein
MAADNETLDELGLLLDSDPRRMTQAGQAQSATTSPTGSQPAAGGGGDGSATASPSAAE